MNTPATDDFNFGVGLFDPYSCRNNDNGQETPVTCTLDEQIIVEAGTSFAAPAVAGSALLVRDYFAQGFYPDGTSANLDNTGDLVPNVSGALVKAALIASGEWLRGFGPGFRGARPAGERCAALSFARGRA